MFGWWGMKTIEFLISFYLMHWAFVSVFSLSGILINPAILAPLNYDVKDGIVFLKLISRVSDSKELYTAEYWIKCKGGGEFHLACLDDTSIVHVDKISEYSYGAKELILTDVRLKERFDSQDVDYKLNSGFAYKRSWRDLKPLLRYNKPRKSFYPSARSLVPSFCAPACVFDGICCSGGSAPDLPDYTIFTTTSLRITSSTKTIIPDMLEGWKAYNVIVILLVIATKLGVCTGIYFNMKYKNTKKKVKEERRKRYRGGRRHCDREYPRKNKHKPKQSLAYLPSYC